MNSLHTSLLGARIRSERDNLAEIVAVWISKNDTVMVLAVYRENGTDLLRETFQMDATELAAHGWTLYQLPKDIRG